MDKAHKRMRGEKPCRWMGTVSRKKSSCLQELTRNPVDQCFTSCNIPMNHPGGLAMYSFWSSSLCGVWEFAYQTNDVDTLIWRLHLPFNQKRWVSCLHLNDYHCVAARMRNYSDPDSKLSLPGGIRLADRLPLRCLQDLSRLPNWSHILSGQVPQQQVSTVILQGLVISKADNRAWVMKFIKSASWGKKQGRKARKCIWELKWRISSSAG